MSSPTECIDALIVRAIYTRFQKKQHDFRRPEIRLREEKGSIRVIMAKTQSYPSMSTKNDFHFKCSHTHASCARTFTVLTWRSKIPVGQGMRLDRWNIIACGRSYLSRRLSYPQMSVSIQLPNIHVQMKNAHDHTLWSSGNTSRTWFCTVGLWALHCSPVNDETAGPTLGGHGYDAYAWFDLRC